MDEAKLRKAIQLNKHGEKQEARILLAEIVAEEPENLTAWFWLVDSLDSLADRVGTLRLALTFHPEDLQLARALRKFEGDLAAEQEFFSEIDTLTVPFGDLPQAGEFDRPEPPPITMGEILNQYLQETDESPADYEVKAENERERKLGSTAVARPAPIEKKAVQPKSRKNQPQPPTKKDSDKKNGTKDQSTTANQQPFWFMVVLILSAFLLCIIGAVWQLFFSVDKPTPPAADFEATATMEITMEEITEEVPAETQTLEPEQTLTPEPSPEVTQTETAAEATATPIIAATITPTPAVPEGQFIPLDGGSFNDFAWSSDGNYFGIATSLGITILDGRSFARKQSIASDPTLPIRAFTFSEDERFVAAGFITRQTAEEYVTRAKSWNISDGAEVFSFDYAKPRGDVDALAFSLDGNTLWTNAIYDQVLKWRVSDGALLAVFGLSNSNVDFYDVVFAPDRRSFITYSLIDRLRMFDSETGEPITTLGMEKNVNSAVYSPNSQYLAVSYQDSGEVRIWDLPGKQEYHLINTHSGGVIAMAFNPFDRILAVKTSDNLIKFYDIHTHEELRVISRQTGNVQQMAFSPDDTMLAVRSTTEIQIWDLQTDRLLATFRISD